MGATHGHAVRGSGDRTYNTWRGMRERCNNKKNISYKNYGGRGLTVCEEWDNSFTKFLSDMGERPDGTSIERLDNDLGYSKSNCVWANSSSQNLNKRPYSLSCKNRTGVVGVFWVEARDTYRVKYKGRHLGTTEDFFEACCLRKSAEVSNEL